MAISEIYCRYLMPVKQECLTLILKMFMSMSLKEDLLKRSI